MQMPQQRVWLGLFALLCWLPLPGWCSEEPEILTESDLFAPLTRVQSVTGLKQRLSETPVATTLIDQEMIKASGAVSVADLFRLVPGFQVYHVNANKFGVVSHGQGSAHPGRMEVMVDGRSVYLPLLSTVDWNALGVSLEDIDYIEVVRGSNVPTQGSNAFLGAINISTKEPIKRSPGKLRFTWGSEHWLQGEFQTSGQLGKMHYGLSGELLHNHGFGVGYKSDDTDHSNPYSLNDGADLGQLNFRGSYAPSLIDSLDLDFGFAKGSIGVGQPHRPEEYGDRDYSANYQSIKWNRLLASGDELEIHAYHNYLLYDHQLYFHVDEDAISLFPLGHPAFDVDVGAEDGTSERYDLSLKLIQQLDFSNRLIWGGGVRHESIKSDILFADKDEVEETFYRFSGNLEHRFNHQWVMNLGAMAEHNDISETHISTRLGLNYQLSPKHSFRAAISQAYRTPSLLEANEELTVFLPDFTEFGSYGGSAFNLISRPYADLRAERVKSAEIGYSWSNPERQQSLDIRLFYENVDDAIDQMEDYSVSAAEDPFDQEVREYRNEAFWTSRGIELQFRLKPWDKAWLYLAYSFTQTDGKYIDTIGYSYYTNAGEFTPQHTLATLLAQQLNPQTQLSLAWYAVSERTWRGSRKLEAYNRVDLRLAHQLSPLPENNATVEFIAQNLFAPYIEFDDNNRMETQAFLRFSVEF